MFQATTERADTVSPNGLALARGNDAYSGSLYPLGSQFIPVAYGVFGAPRIGKETKGASISIYAFITY